MNKYKKRIKITKSGMSEYNKKIARLQPITLFLPVTTFAVYNLFHFCIKIDYIANNMDQDQTADTGFIVFASMMKSSLKWI